MPVSGSDLAAPTGVSRSSNQFSFSASNLHSGTPILIQTLTGSRFDSGPSDSDGVIVSYYFSPASTGSFSTTLVAALASGTASDASVGYGLVGSSSTVILSVADTNIVIGANTTANNASYSQAGPTTGSSSVFIGTASSFSLQDFQSAETGKQISSTYSYTVTRPATGGATTNLVTSLTDGLDSTTAAASDPTTLSVIAVAPVQTASANSTATATAIASASPSVSASVATYARSGSTGTIATIGSGNMAGSAAVNGPRGAVSDTLAASFLGAASSSVSGTAASTLGYTYTPVSRGTRAATRR
jgi:hypothetical protein